MPNAREGGRRERRGWRPGRRGKTLEEIVLGSTGIVFNQAAQIWNHTFYWNGLKPNPQGAANPPTGAVKALIDRDFGSFEKFQEQFTAAGGATLHPRPPPCRLPSEVAPPRGCGWRSPTHPGAVARPRGIALHSPLLLPGRPRRRALGTSAPAGRGWCAATAGEGQTSAACV